MPKYGWEMSERELFANFGKVIKYPAEMLNELYDHIFNVEAKSYDEIPFDDKRRHVPQHIRDYNPYWTSLLLDTMRGGNKVEIREQLDDIISGKELFVELSEDCGIFRRFRVMKATELEGLL